MEEDFVRDSVHMCVSTHRAALSIPEALGKLD